jgi:DNA-binding transcriptional MerR regulator
MANKQTMPLPPIPDKRYFTISEASELCLVEPHVLRFWEKEFTYFRPTKRTGNRRYYQISDLNMAREIRRLLYDEGFTISGARQRLTVYKQQVKEAKPLQEVKFILRDAIKELDEISEQLKV